MAETRAELADLITFVRTKVADAAASTWSSSQSIIDALDNHATRFDWVPLYHETDYHRFECKPRSDTLAREVTAGTRDVARRVLEAEDFGAFYRVGYFDTQWEIRDSPSQAGSLQSPSVARPFPGVFIFSTAVQRELFVRAVGYNVWNAAADLLMETPDAPDGRAVVTSRRRGQVAHTQKGDKWHEYSRRGYHLNRRRGRWTRA